MNTYEVVNGLRIVATFRARDDAHAQRIFALGAAAKKPKWSIRCTFRKKGT